MLTVRKKKVFIAASVLVLLGAITVAGIYGVRLLAIATAYKAKILCSEVFVAGRDSGTVLVDMDTADLSALRLIDAFINNEEKTVTASFHGLAESKVCYRGNEGCAYCFASKAVAREGQGSETPLRLKKGTPVWPADSGCVDNLRLEAALDDAFSEPDPEHPRRTRAVVVVKKGRIAAERYAADIGQDTPLLGWSMTKSVINALVGILVKSGRISLDTPVPVDAWKAPADPRGRITIKHLLHMSSGLAFNEEMSDPLAEVTRMVLRTRDMAKFAANKPLEAEPGTRWKYSSGSTNILSGILRSVLYDEEYHRFPRETLFNRIGMSSAVLETDAAGTFVGSSFMYATARDWARFGLLYLQDGIWDGERILPEGWVRFSGTPAPSDTQKAYGAHFWLLIPVKYRGNGKELPEDAFHAVGHEGQFVTIVPSRDTVIVRFGKTRYPQGWKHDGFVMNVLAALDESQ